MANRERTRATWWPARLLRSDRAGASTAGTVAVLIGVVLVAYHVAAHGVLPGISDIGAWLPNTGKGSVVHVNGLAGKPDAQVTLRSAEGHPLRVVQDGGQVLVIDTVTGVVSRIDPSQLTVTQSVNYGTAGAQIVTGAGIAYLVDGDHGLVQQIDLAKLSAVGSPTRLGKQLGPSGVDGEGTLWAPVPSDGHVIPVADGKTGTPVVVGHPGDSISLTIAGGTPVVTNSTQATMTVVSRTGGQVTVNLPAATGTPPPPLLAPQNTDSALVPVVVSGAGQLVVVDTKKGVPTSVTLAELSGHSLGAPTVLGARVYVPDNTTGRLIVYDSAGGQLLDQINVTGRPSKLELFVKDGMLWVNDPEGPDAVTVDATGKVHHVGKYNPDLPGGPLPTPSPRPTDSPSPSGQSTKAHDGDKSPKANNPNPGSGQNNGQGNQNNSPTPSPADTQTTTPTTSSAPPPPPPSTQPPPPPLQAPKSVTETPKEGSIEVTFTPVTRGGLTDYTLTDVPSDASVDPPSIPPSGTAYRFTVKGLSCATVYQFSVSANYSSGSVSTKASGGARPCTVPKAPDNLRFDTGTEHQIGVAWDATTDNGGASVKYVVSWSGKNSPDLTTTNYTITGLANFQTYLVSVAAKNDAGSSKPPASGSVDLKRGPWQGKIGNNQLYPVNLRADANTSSRILSQFPVGGGQSVTVHCIKDGGPWVDPTGSPSGSTWYQLDNPQGYVASAYVIVSGVWKCS
jgi:hypothetical protein